VDAVGTPAKARLGGAPAEAGGVCGEDDADT